MLSQSVDEEPLLPWDKESPTATFISSEHSGSAIPPLAHRKLTRFALIMSLGLNAIFIICNVLLVLKLSVSVPWKGSKPVYSMYLPRYHSDGRTLAALIPHSAPAQDAVSYEPVQFESLWHVRTKYDGPPSPGVDKAWEDLYHMGISAIPKSQAVHLPNRTEIYSGDVEHYIVELDIFHQLHCLNMVRKAIWPDYYPQTERFSNFSTGLFDHVDHCINAIRQSLMCNADLTPVVWHWSERDNSSYVDFNAVHTCKSWDAVHEWAWENTAKVKFDPKKHVTDNLVFPDDPVA